MSAAFFLSFLPSGRSEVCKKVRWWFCYSTKGVGREIVLLERRCKRGLIVSNQGCFGFVSVVYELVFDHIWLLSFLLFDTTTRVRLTHLVRIFFFLVSIRSWFYFLNRLKSCASNQICSHHIKSWFKRHIIKLKHVYRPEYVCVCMCGFPLVVRQTVV